MSIQAVRSMALRFPPYFSAHPLHSRLVSRMQPGPRRLNAALWPWLIHSKGYVRDLRGEQGVLTLFLHSGSSPSFQQLAKSWTVKFLDTGPTGQGTEGNSGKCISFSTSSSSCT